MTQSISAWRSRPCSGMGYEMSSVSKVFGDNFLQKEPWRSIPLPLSLPPTSLFETSIFGCQQWPEAQLDYFGRSETGHPEMGNSSPNILKLLDHHPRNAVHLIGIPSTSLIIHYLHYWLQCAPPTECTSVIHLGYFNNIPCHGHFLQERQRWLSHHYPSNILSSTPSKFGNKPQFLFLPLEHLIPQYHGCNLTRKTGLIQEVASHHLLMSIGNGPRMLS